MGRQELPGSPDPNEQFQRALTRPGGVAAATCATRVLRGVGPELAGAENPHSASNDVWLLPGYCLRMARRPGEGGLLREARLADVLPAEVGYPRILAAGVEEGYEWLLAERLPGLNLWDAWPTLTPRQRLEAVEELWRRHLALQQADSAALAGLMLPPHPRYRFTPSEAASQLRRLATAGVLEEGLTPALWGIIERGLTAIRMVPWRLVHGDPGFTNAQYHEGRVIGLLDLETACIAPCDMDLQPLLRMLADPLDDPGSPGPHGLPTPESFAGAFERLVQTAMPLLRQPGAPQRFRGYAVLFALTILDNALRRGVAAETLRGWTGDITAAAAGRSYVDRLWPGGAA